MRILAILLLVLVALASVRCVKEEPKGYEANENVVPNAVCVKDCINTNHACR